MSLNRILYSIYTGEYPNQSTGGPNNIIYKLIANYKNEEYEFDYLSSDLFVENLNANSIFELRNRLSPKKKTASLLSQKSKLYRKFFGSDLYLPYHFYKKSKYYKTFSKNIAKYDIIHCQDSISLSLIDNSKNTSKRIMTVHSKGPLSDEVKNMPTSKKLQKSIDKKLKEIEIKNIKLADLITFPSIAAKKYFENSLETQLDKSKVRIIYNGIGFDKIQSLVDDNILIEYSIERKQDQMLILNIAGDAPEKRIDLLLKIVSTIKQKLKQDVLLLNIGVEKGGSRYLKTLIKGLNIESNVKFLGKLQNDDVIKLLKATDMFLMTSEKVIFDLVVLEALACGTCCVVSDDGGNKEIITEGVNGYFISPNDIEKSASKIISVNTNQVKENAIKTAKMFSVKKMVDEYFVMYEELLNGI